MSKHTPGPWKAKKKLFYGSQPVWEVEHGSKGESVCMTDNADPNQEADAHLIAAAPDLLEVAEDFVAKVDRGDARSTDSYAKFSAAIAKATP